MHRSRVDLALWDVQSSKERGSRWSKGGGDKRKKQGHGNSGKERILQGVPYKYYSVPGHVKNWVEPENAEEGKLSGTAGQGKKQALERNHAVRRAWTKYSIIMRTPRALIAAR